MSDASCVPGGVKVTLARVRVFAMDDVSTKPEAGSLVSPRVVGRRVPGDLLDPRVDTKAKARAWREALPTPFVPKGVYRFDSHEEAQQWLEKTLTRSR